MSTSYEFQSGRLLKRTRCNMLETSTNSFINTKNASLGMAIMSKSKL